MICVGPSDRHLRKGTAIVTLNENGDMDINGFLTDDVRKVIGLK